MTAWGVRWAALPLAPAAEEALTDRATALASDSDPPSVVLLLSAQATPLPAETSPVWGLGVAASKALSGGTCRQGRHTGEACPRRCSRPPRGASHPRKTLALCKLIPGMAQVCLSNEFAAHDLSGILSSLAILRLEHDHHRESYPQQIPQHLWRLASCPTPCWCFCSLATNNLRAPSQTRSHNRFDRNRRKRADCRAARQYRSRCGGGGANCTGGARRGVQRSGRDQPALVPRKSRCYRGGPIPPREALLWLALAPHSG